MKIYVLACAAALVLALVAVVVLTSINQPSDAAFASPTGVRLGS